jgi:hypothetical protein
VVYAKVMLQKGAHNCVSTVLIIISIEIKQSAFILSRVRIWNVYVLMNILPSKFPLANIPRLLGKGHRELKAKRRQSVEGRRMPFTERGHRGREDTICGGGEDAVHRDTICEGRTPLVKGGKKSFIQSGRRHLLREGGHRSSREGGSVHQGREDAVRQGREEAVYQK